MSMISLLREFQDMYRCVTALVAEKHAVEERLKQELESEREKDKKLTEELLLQKAKLEKVITYT